MKVLFFTRKIDKFDDRMGVYHDYVLSLARKAKFVHVVCLEKGTYEFPKNVRVHSLGKERGKSALGSLLISQRIFLKIIPEVDVIFCHMNPIYTIMSWPLAFLHGKKIVTWYGHVSMTFKVRVALFLSKFLVTSDPSAIRLQSKKLRFIGHGINANQFRSTKKRPKNTIIWLGRISRIKKIELLIFAMKKVVQQKKNVKLNLYGEPSGDPEYLKELKSLIKKNKLDKNIFFKGKIANIDAVHAYNDATIYVSMLKYGGSGKTNLEAMATQRPILTPSIAFKGIITKYEKDFFFKDDDVDDFANKILSLLNMSDRELDRRGVYLRSVILKKFSLDGFIDRLMKVFSRV